MTIVLTVIVWAAIIMIFCGVAMWAASLLEFRKLEAERAAYWRKDYQRRIRMCIMNMADGIAQHEDLEWHLHSLLYEYRHGTPAD